MQTAPLTERYLCVAVLSRLLTGGAGYVGSHTTIEIINAGYSAVVIDNLVNASMVSIKRVEEITGMTVARYSVDLLDKQAIQEVFSKHKFDCVIHTAALKAVGESCELPLTYYKNNIVGTLNLLEVMKDNKVFNLIISSSGTVYGDPQYLPLDEKHPTGGCSNPYGNTKFFIEQIISDMAKAQKAWNIVLFRYFNPVGCHKSGLIGENPLGRPHNLMPYVSQVAVGRQKFLKVYGDDFDTHDGTGVRDYVHVIDLAKAHVAALKKLNEKCGRKIYNLATGKGYSVLDMVKAFEKASGKRIPYKIYPRREGDLAAFYGDATLATKELGWKVERGLDEMCEDLWRWQSKNPHGFKVENGF